MASVIQTNFRCRKNLGRVSRIVEVPNLIDIQKSSYDKFLQTSVPPNDREDVGLQAVFRSVFPIKDFTGTSELVFVSYNLEKPKYDEPLFTMYQPSSPCNPPGQNRMTLFRQCPSRVRPGSPPPRP